ncbi:MAG: pilus assembly protein [Proteobacteria bacterium]|nr:pilus assembly protein [Pseudomonadota bacterium]MCH7831813.1 pilus assembly protein [Pseudomonadota bacterium]
MQFKSATFDRRTEKPAATAFARLRRGWDKMIACRLGATAVEFAIVAPLFLAMMVGLFDMSRAMWIKATLQFAAEEATRSFLVDNTLTTTQVATLAETSCTGAGMNASVCVNAFTANLTTSGTIQIMQVTATYNFETFMSAIQFNNTSIIPFSNVTLNAKSSVPLNS